MSTIEGVNQASLRTLIERARDEDLGGATDITSMLLDDSWAQTVGRWELRAREAGRFAGAALLPTMLEVLAPDVMIEWVKPDADGADMTAGEAVARFAGPVGPMLTAERTLLNFLQHLCGVASVTSRFVKAVAGTDAGIYDTRKTLPGFRELDKYAVRCGGGHNHRAGLYDAVLIKDNHLAGIPSSRLAHAVMMMLSGVSRLPATPAFIEVECDNLEQFAELLKVVGIDGILLDNFSPADMRTAVEMRDRAGLRGKVQLEASGGVSLATVTDIARTGVERIAVGAITHSAPALDLGLDVVGP